MDTKPSKPAPSEITVQWTCYIGGDLMLLATTLSESSRIRARLYKARHQGEYSSDIFVHGVDGRRGRIPAKTRHALDVYMEAAQLALISRI